MGMRPPGRCEWREKGRGGGLWCECADRRTCCILPDNLADGTQKFCLGCGRLPTAAFAHGQLLSGRKTGHKVAMNFRHPEHVHLYEKEPDDNCAPKSRLRWHTSNILPISAGYGQFFRAGCRQTQALCAAGAGRPKILGASVRRFSTASRMRLPRSTPMAGCSTGIALWSRSPPAHL